MNPSEPMVGLQVGILKSGLGITDTYLRGVHRVRQSQIDQISASTTECRHWLQQADGVADFGRLQSLQSDIVSGQVERVFSYWKQVGHDLLGLQHDLLQALQDSGHQTTQALRQQLEQLQSGLSQGGNGLLRPVLDPSVLFRFGAGRAAEVQDVDASPRGARNGGTGSAAKRAEPAPR
jgi:hypothetical protein